jgi:hypothetical protein
MHGEDYRSNDTSSASGIPTAPSSTPTRSRGLHCERSCPGVRSTHRPAGARVYLIRTQARACISGNSAMRPEYPQSLCARTVSQSYKG